MSHASPAGAATDAKVRAAARTFAPGARVTLRALADAAGIASQTCQSSIDRQRAAGGWPFDFPATKSGIAATAQDTEARLLAAAGPLRGREGVCMLDLARAAGMPKATAFKARRRLQARGETSLDFLADGRGRNGRKAGPPKVKVVRVRGAACGPGGRSIWSDGRPMYPAKPRAEPPLYYLHPDSFNRPKPPASYAEAKEAARRELAAWRAGPGASA